jgi:hypothetical protein
MQTLPNIGSHLPKVRLFDAFMEFFLRRSPRVANQLPILWPLLVKELNVLLLCKTFISMVYVLYGNTNSNELIINYSRMNHVSSVIFLLHHIANFQLRYTSSLKLVGNPIKHRLFTHALLTLLIAHLDVRTSTAAYSSRQEGNWNATISLTPYF